MWRPYTLDIFVVFWILILLKPLSASRNVWLQHGPRHFCTHLHAYGNKGSKKSAETKGTQRYPYDSAHCFHTAFFFALLYFEFSSERACTFHKCLKLVTVVTVLSIVTALRRKSVLVVMGDAKSAVNSSFRAHYLLPFSCFVDIHVCSHS
jgi:hypothetical protein